MLKIYWTLSLYAYKRYACKKIYIFLFSYERSKTLNWKIYEILTTKFFVCLFM